MGKRVFFRLLAVFMLTGMSAACADPYTNDELNWLKKIAAAARNLEYAGTFVYQSGSYIETSRITHLRDGANELERLEGLNGEKSEVIRRNDQVWCYQGDTKTMVARRDGARTFPALLPEKLDWLQENYRISHGEDERVAGLIAHSVQFNPRDRMRYAHRMWAHNDTGMLLRAIVQDETGAIIDQYAFTQLQIGGGLDRTWIRPEYSAAHGPGSSTEESKGGQARRPVSVDSGWSASMLPAGFRKVAEVSRFMKGSETPVIHLVYSDGLAGISVFIEKLNGRQAPRQGTYGKGVTHVYTRNLDDNVLTVVGEVPARTVMQVGESVKYHGVLK